MSRKQYSHKCPWCQTGFGNVVAYERHMKVCSTPGAPSKSIKTRAKRPLLIAPSMRNPENHCPECNMYFSDVDMAAECRESHIPAPTEADMDEARSRMMELERLLRKKQQIPPTT